MTAATSPRAHELLAAAQAAGEAARLVLARSDLWLALHPFQHRRLRADMLRKHDHLLDVRAEWRKAGRPV